MALVSARLPVLHYTYTTALLLYRVNLSSRNALRVKQLQHTDVDINLI